MSLIDGGIKNIMENKTRDERIKRMAHKIMEYCSNNECALESCIFFSEQGRCMFDTPPVDWSLLED